MIHVFFFTASFFFFFSCLLFLFHFAFLRGHGFFFFCCLLLLGLLGADVLALEPRIALTDVAGKMKITRALNLDGGSSCAFVFAGENGVFSIREQKTVRDFVVIVPRGGR